MPDTAYEFKVRAENVCGTGPFSETFLTEMKKVPGAPEMTVATNECYFEVEWEEPYNGGYNITEYKVEIETKVEGVWASDNIDCKSNNSCRILMIMLLLPPHSLRIGSPINARVSALNHIGWGPPAEAEKPTLYQEPFMMLVPKATLLSKN